MARYRLISLSILAADAIRLKIVAASWIVLSVSVVVSTCNAVVLESEIQLYGMALVKFRRFS